MKIYLSEDAHTTLRKYSEHQKNIIMAYRLKSLGDGKLRITLIITIGIVI